METFLGVVAAIWVIVNYFILRSKNVKLICITSAITMIVVLGALFLHNLQENSAAPSATLVPGQPTTHAQYVMEQTMLEYGPTKKPR